MPTDFIYFYLFLILSKILIANDFSTLHILTIFYFVLFCDACENMKAKFHVEI